MPDYSDYDFERDAHAEGDSVILDFGKYCGDSLEEVPTAYLKWMEDQYFAEDLVTAVEEELARRE